MPVTCIIVNCGSRGMRDKVSFYAVPDVLNSKYFQHLNELSRKRRQKWLSAIRRDDLTPSILRNQKVCSRHFITGKPSKLVDVDHPDWAPSQNLGHMSQVAIKRKGDLQRKVRADKRRKVISDAADTRENKLALEVHDDPAFVDAQDQENEVATQTDLTMEKLTLKFDQLKFAAEKISKLERKIENCPFGLMDDTKNDGKWRYYTGFNYELIQQIFGEVEPYISSTSTTVLSPFNQFTLTFIKLRLNLHFKHLAYCFKISPTTASTYFLTMVDILYERFKSLIKWPDQSLYQINMPTCFKEAFQEKTTVIIDCFEVFIEKPANYLTQQQCWSNYKHHHTVKFLIGITPQGTVSYISQAWGGRTSDKQMVELSNFCNYIKPGDVVLADRGFLINETLSILGAKLVIPAFTKGKTQLHPLDIESTRHIAHVRIHVERIIGMIKNKFNFFQGPIAISMLKKGNNSDANILDKLVTTCCALINLSNPIVPI